MEINKNLSAIDKEREIQPTCHLKSIQNRNILYLQRKVIRRCNCERQNNIA